MMGRPGAAVPPSESAAPGTPETCDKDSFREVIGHFASGVAVITTRFEGRRHGMTASAVTSLSLEPPMMLICLNRAAPTCAAVSRAGAFGVNILSENQGVLAERFARPSADKFAGVEVEEGRLGLPLLTGALARLECRIAEEVRGGTHTVFLAHVANAEAAAGSPLAYFRGRFGRLALVEDDTVYDELRRRILLGEFAESEQLDARVLAEELAVEPWHVYHALTRLVGEELVARDAVRGYVIAPVTLNTVEDALDGRRAIELGVAELSVGHVSGDDLAELRRRMEATVPLVADAHFVDVRDYAIANAGFHEHMVGLARSDALLHAYRRLGLVGILARSLRPTDEALDGLVLDHQELVDAYERGDLATAKRVIDRHTERAKLTHRLAYEHDETDDRRRQGGR